MDIAGWNERYKSGEHGSQDLATILLVEAVENLPAGTAIDLACGTGRNAFYLAKRGWTVTAVDGSESAIELLRKRAVATELHVHSAVADLTAPTFTIPADEFDLVLMAYYLQRDLFAKAKAAVKPGGLLVAIVHIPEPGEAWSEKRARRGELRTFFVGWDVLWQYEGPSRDPAHRRPVSEIIARRPLS